MYSNSKNKFWDLKPPWCQPWSIISFGIIAEVLIWISFHNVILTLIVGLLILLWWILFLIIAPISFEKYHEDEIM